MLAGYYIGETYLGNYGGIVTYVLALSDSVTSSDAKVLTVTAVDEGTTSMPIAWGNTGSKNTWASLNSTTTGIFRVWDANNDLGNFTSTNPITFTTGSRIQMKGFYEAA